MTYKNGEVVIDFDKPYSYSYYRRLVQKRPCFYVVQPVFSNELDFIKIGKSSNALLRLDQYSRLWKIKFRILYLVYFRDYSKARSVHIENETSKIYRDLKDKFERDVISTLKKNEVEPYYSNVSNEFYHSSTIKDVKDAINAVRYINETNKDATKIVKNRRMHNRYNLRSNI